MGREIQAQLLADCACHIGENPLWHPKEQMLYWTDIPTGRLFRYEPTAGAHEQIYEGRPVGGFTFQADGGLLLFQDRGTIASLKDGVLTELLAEITAEEDSRFNDVIADPAGRIFCGTMSTSDNKGRLYRLDVDGSLHLLLEGIGCSNGMAFDRDCKHFYYTDSFAREIYRFNYSEDYGTISSQTVFSSFDEGDGLPDGATLDSEGQLWSALWDGGCVVRLSNNGEIAERFPVPVAKTASLTFGGKDFATLFISTAGGDERERDGPLAGGLFSLIPGTKGLPEYFSRIEGTKIVLRGRSSQPNPEARNL